VDQFFQPLITRIALFIEELVVLLPVEQAGFAQRLADRPPQTFERVVGVEVVELVVAPVLRPPPVMPPELVLEAAAQKGIAQGFHQLFQADVVPTLARPFGIFGVSHSSHRRHRDTEDRGSKIEDRRSSNALRSSILDPRSSILCGSVAKPLSQRRSFTVRGRAYSTA